MDSGQVYGLKLLLLGSALPLLAIAFAASSWRALSHRALFLLVSILSLYGLYSCVYPLVLNYLYPSRFAVENPHLDVFYLMGATDALSALFGLPVLWWLRNALRRT